MSDFFVLGILIVGISIWLEVWLQHRRR